MSTFFGRPVGQLLADVGFAAGIGAVLGGAVGYQKARQKHDANPFIRAMHTSAEWAVSDAVTETVVGIFAPNLRKNGVFQSATILGAIGGTTGFLEGYASAKAHGDDDPMHEALITAGEWAALDSGIEIAAHGIYPKFRQMTGK